MLSEDFLTTAGEAPELENAAAFYLCLVTGMPYEERPAA